MHRHAVPLCDSEQKTGKTLVWKDMRWHTALCVHIHMQIQKHKWRAVKKGTDYARICKPLGRSRLGRRERRQADFFFPRWGAGNVLENKGSDYVSTTNAHSLFPFFFFNPQNYLSIQTELARQTVSTSNILSGDITEKKKHWLPWTLIGTTQFLRIYNQKPIGKAGWQWLS